MGAVGTVFELVGFIIVDLSDGSCDEADLGMRTAGAPRRMCRFFGTTLTIDIDLMFEMTRAAELAW